MNINDKSRWTTTLMGQVVIGALSRLPAEKQKEYWDAHPPPAYGDPPRDVDVRVLLDGYDLDVTTYFDELEFRLECDVVDRAGELLKRQIGDVTGRLHDAIDVLIDGIRKQAIDALGYNPWEHE